MKLKLDLHVHTTRSRDAFTALDHLPRLAKNSGLDGAAVTDHNCALDLVVGGTIVVPGIEISSSEGHVIGLGITAPIPRGLSADQTINEIHRMAGVAVIPHPYDLFRKSVRPERLTARPDAIEVVNSSNFLHSVTWKRGRKYAQKAGLPMVAGSDSHIPQTIGRAYTVVDTDSGDIPGILDAIRKGSVTPSGRPISIWDRLRKTVLSTRRA